MRDELRQEIAVALQTELVRCEPQSGGCISEAFACHLSDGRTAFVKTKESCPANMFRAEATGLAWLAEAKALRTPKLLAVGDHFLALEYIAPGAPAACHDQNLGRGLARLHRFGAKEFGLAEDGFLATLSQDNRATEKWGEFYAARRLLPLIRRAVDHDLVPASWGAKFDPFLARLPEFLGDETSVARLHGDLWAGNVLAAADGEAVLIDPAAYGGHREIDLAMLSLFGSPSARFLSAYNEVWPLEPGRQDREALYQLYPLLAHVNLFGGSYVSSCEKVLRAYL